MELKRTFECGHTEFFPPADWSLSAAKTEKPQAHICHACGEPHAQGKHLADGWYCTRCCRRYDY